MAYVTQQELDKKRSNWKDSLSMIYLIRLNFSRCRGEKWIQLLWSKTECSTKDMENMHKEKFWCYALFNTKTKKFYIGETAQTLTKRLAHHVYDVKNEVDRNIFRYIRRHRVMNWMIIPLQHYQDKNTQKVDEKTWMHFFRTQLINDPMTWSKHPDLWNKTDRKV